MTKKVDRINEKGYPDDLMILFFRKETELEGNETEGDGEEIAEEDISKQEVDIIEELQSMNEELQSTTEELETSQEELQSVNEELKTVNRELDDKVEELQHTNSDLKNLMEATEIAIIFVDRDFCLSRFTSKVTEIFNLRASDLGRPLEHFTHRLTYDSLSSDIKEVLDNLKKIEKQ